MLLEISRLMLGVAIALFHRQLADFLWQQDRALVVMFRQRGLPLPDAMERKTAHDVFFVMGILVAVYQLARIYYGTF